MDEYTFDVSGMTCGGCEIIVTGEVVVLPGVSRVDADAAAGRVTVVGDVSVKRRVRETIEDAGYSVSG